MEDDYLLTFELDKNKDAVEVFTDVKGLKFLIDELSKLLKSIDKNNVDHAHFMTEDWGGYELTSVAQSGEIINHVKVYCKKSE